MTGASDLSTVSGAYGALPDFLFGVILTTLSAFSSTLGNLLMKYAQTKEDEKQAQGLKSKRVGSIPVCNLYWWAGFLTLAVLPTPLDIFSLQAAAQSIIYPLGAGLTIVFTQLLAPCSVGEKLTLIDWISTLLIVAGSTLAVAFGSQEAQDYSLGELLEFFSYPPFLAWFITIWVISIVIMVFWQVRRLTMIEKFPGITIILLGFVAATWAAAQGIVLKGSAELLASLSPNTTETAASNATLDGNDDGAFSNYEAWLFVIAVPIVGAAQLVFMNFGLENFKAVKFIPVYNTIVVVVSAVTGALYFGELDNLDPIWFPVGLVIVCLGISLLTLKNTQDEAHLELEIRNHSMEFVNDIGELETGGAKKLGSRLSSSDDESVATPKISTVNPSFSGDFEGLESPDDDGSEGAPADTSGKVQPSDE